MRLCLAIAALALFACTMDGTGVEQLRFSCSSDGDCIDGHLCRAGECVASEIAPGSDASEDAGADAGFDAGGESDAGGGEDGGDAGPDGGGSPSRLSFATAALTVPAGQCSPAVVVEALDALDRPAPVQADVAVSLDAAPSGGFGFYADGACANAASSVSIRAGSSRASFHFRGTATGQVVVTAQAMGLSVATQNEVIAPGPPARVTFTTPARTLPAGTCSVASTIRLEDAFGNVAPAPAQTSLALTATPTGSLRFYSDAACRVAATSVQLAPGTSSAIFYFAGVSGGNDTVSVSGSGLLAASQAQQILPAVRSGTCSIAAGATTVSCPVAPPQTDVTKTLLVFQSASADPTPAGSNVRCLLGDAGIIDCTRSGTAGIVSIRWHTAELPWASVQRLQPTCANGTVTLNVPIAAVDAGSAFVLLSHHVDGVNQSRDDFFTAELSSPTNVQLRVQPGEDCSADHRLAVQVVELDGVSVTRGVAGPMTGTSLAVTAPAVNLASTALFFSYTVDGGTGLNEICDRMLRGSLTSPTTITFTRGCTGAVIERIAWERVDFSGRASVQRFSASMAAQAASASAMVQPVDVTRSLPFSAAQAVCGQAGGQASYALDDIIGEGIALMRLVNGTTVQLDRGSTLGAATFDGQVLQLEP